MSIILISACLIGYPCNYKRQNHYYPELVLRLQQRHILLPVCPEMLGGLDAPRLPCEIIGGAGQEVLQGTAKVMNIHGEDCTKAFLNGAARVRQIALNGRINIAVLKSNSPSCGLGAIYDGTFQGNKTEGNGVAAEMLLQSGIEVYSEEDYIVEAMKEIP